MTEEIKRILDYLINEKAYLHYGIRREKFIELEGKEVKTLLDYITNLQQDLEKANDIIEKDRKFYKCRMDEYAELKKENETLKAKLEIGKTCGFCPYYDYKSRCEKVVEYIMTELITEWDIENDGCVSGSDLPANAITPILNILQGSDENDRLE